MHACVHANLINNLRKSKTREDRAERKVTANTASRACARKRTRLSSMSMSMAEHKASKTQRESRTSKISKHSSKLKRSKTQSRPKSSMRCPMGRCRQTTQQSSNNPPSTTSEPSRIGPPSAIGQPASPHKTTTVQAPLPPAHVHVC
jgi:hypothetical protein